MLKTHLIQIPQNNQKKAKAFEDLLNQLHEVLTHETLALEIITFGQNIGFCFTANIPVSEIVKGHIYAMSPDADIIKIPDYIEKTKNSLSFASTELKLKKMIYIQLKLILILKAIVYLDY